MIRNIANPLLASALLPDMFCNKNNAISPEAIKGEPLKLPPGEWLQQTAKAFDTAAIISPPGERRPEWISLEKQGRRP